MSNILEEINSLVDRSPLSSSDRDMFMKALRGAKEEHLRNLLELFKKDQNAIEEVYNNFQVKRSVLATKDAKTWQAILNAEEKKLEEST